MQRKEGEGKDEAFFFLMETKNLRGVVKVLRFEFLYRCGTVCTIVRMEPFFRRTSVHLNCSTAQMLHALYCCRNLNKDIQLNYRGPGLKKKTQNVPSLLGVCLKEGK